MQLYVTEEAFPAQSYYAEHWTPVYMKSDVDAALAAKDAEIERLTALINDHNVAVHAKCQANELEHCRSYTSRGRLCPSCPQEWLISGVLDAIDAHQEPKP